MFLLTAYSFVRGNWKAVLIVGIVLALAGFWWHYTSSMKKLREREIEVEQLRDQVTVMEKSYENFTSRYREQVAESQNAIQNWKAEQDRINSIQRQIHNLALATRNQTAQVVKETTAELDTATVAQNPRAAQAKLNASVSKLFYSISEASK